ncbi:MAG: rhodanese-like domain-containing protein [Woeseiaceae bacterium]
MSTLKLKKIFTSLVALVMLASFSTFTIADDWSKLSSKKQTKLGLYMTAKQAYKHTMDKMDQTLFVDIRTPSELNYLGAATVMDAHVPTVFMDTTGWNDKKHRYNRAKNKNFVADIGKALKKKGLSKSDTIILMCRSGKRSASAANTLADNGYTKVYSVVDGYEGGKVKKGENKGKRMKDGWKNSGLPWTYSLDKDYMYITK